MTSQVLSEKVGVVFGVANKRSIAWAIAKAWAAAGARLIFNYQGERLKENVEELVGEFGEGTPFFPCDVSSDDQIKKFFEQVRGQTQVVDLVLHSLAFAPKEALEGDFVSTTREAFRTAHDISAYSLVALAREVAPLMTNGGSILAVIRLWECDPARLQGATASQPSFTQNRRSGERRSLRLNEMIARIWHGWTKPENAKAYEDMLRDEIFPSIAARNINGYRGAELFINQDADEVEFVTLLRFDSLDAVKDFAGADEGKPVIYPKAEALLIRMDERSRHYRIVT